MITLNPVKCKDFLPLTQEKIKLFCKMCEIVLYKPEDHVNLENGGVLLRGHLDKMNKEKKIGVIREEDEAMFQSSKRKNEELENSEIHVTPSNATPL